MGEKKRSQVAQQLRSFVAANLRHYRVEAGLTQAQLAEIVQVEPRHLQLLEAGTAAPSIDLLAELAQALGTSAPLLLEPRQALLRPRGRPKA